MLLFASHEISIRMQIRIYWMQSWYWNSVNWNAGDMITIYKKGNIGPTKSINIKNTSLHSSLKFTRHAGKRDVFRTCFEFLGIDWKSKCRYFGKFCWNLILPRNPGMSEPLDKFFRKLSNDNTIGCDSKHGSCSISNGRWEMAHQQTEMVIENKCRKRLTHLVFWCLCFSFSIVIDTLSKSRGCATRISQPLNDSSM